MSDFNLEWSMFDLAHAAAKKIAANAAFKEIGVREILPVDIRWVDGTCHYQPVFDEMCAMLGTVVEEFSERQLRVITKIVMVAIKATHERSLER